jgi:hypothetical protein
MKPAEEKVFLWLKQANSNLDESRRSPTAQALSTNESGTPTMAARARTGKTHSFDLPYEEPLTGAGATRRGISIYDSFKEGAYLSRENASSSPNGLHAPSNALIFDLMERGHGDDDDDDDGLALSGSKRVHSPLVCISYHAYLYLFMHRCVCIIMIEVYVCV